MTGRSPADLRLPPDPRQPPGLRERKKLATRQALSSAALELALRQLATACSQAPQPARQ